MVDGVPGIPVVDPEPDRWNPRGEPLDIITAARNHYFGLLGRQQLEANALAAQRMQQDQMRLGQFLMGGASAVYQAIPAPGAIAGGLPFDPNAGQLNWDNAPPILRWAPTYERSEEDIRKEKEALDRAYALLEESIGKQEAARIEAGGAYIVPSKRWPSVAYGIAKTGRVLIFDRSRLWRRKIVAESCIATCVGNLPWPDIVLAKIKAIQADETIVFATGNVSTR